MTMATTDHPHWHDGLALHEHAQKALLLINCSHPDGAVTDLQGVLARLVPDSPDARAIQRAIDRLEQLAGEIAKVEYALAGVDFSFGKLEV
jgi:hypothetical protein